MDWLAYFILIVFPSFYIGVVIPKMGGWGAIGNGCGYAEGFKYGALAHMALVALVGMVAGVGWAAVTVFQ